MHKPTKSNKEKISSFPQAFQFGQTGTAFWGGKSQLQHQGRAHIKVLHFSVPISELALNMLKARGTSKHLSRPRETLPVEY